MANAERRLRSARLRAIADERCHRFTCGYCDAPSGERCRRDSGLIAAVHQDRFMQATRAGLLPLTDDDLAEAHRA